MTKTINVKEVVDSSWKISIFGLILEGFTAKRHNIFFCQKQVSGESGLCLFIHKFNSIDERNLTIIERREFPKVTLARKKLRK